MSSLKTHIITHRGLDPSYSNFPPESSVEAFSEHLKRRFGIEFDIQFTKNEKLIVLHDATLKRLTKGEDERQVSEVDSSELLSKQFNGGHLASLEQLFQMIESSHGEVSALHIKSKMQETEHLDLIIEMLKKVSLKGGPNQKGSIELLAFDVKIDTAEYIKQKMPYLPLAASVAHPYDIERFNSAVGGTLLSIDEVIANKHLYDWVWLDEWDLEDKDGGKKTFYNKENFELLRNHGFKISLITPELHGTSPGLLGGEKHPDSDPDRLFSRIEEIIKLSPNAVCTDYPDAVRKMIIALQNKA